MHVNVCELDQLLAGFLQYNGGKVEEADDFQVVSSFTVCSNRNRSAIVCDLLSYNSLFVGQLYKDLSLALRARDLIFLTTDLRIVNYYSTNHC